MTIPKQKVFPLILEEKEREAIAFIQEHEPPEGYALAFSGGKDSVVIYDLAERSGVNFRPHYCNTTIDPPAVHKFIRKHYPDVKWLRSEKSFWQWFMTAKRPEKPKPKGPPLRLKRWCCEYLKELPAKNEGAHLLEGIRAGESNKRAKRGQVSKHCNANQTIYAPIFNWSTQDVWAYIRKHDLPYLSLYENEGCRRVGCVICPFLRPVEKLRSQRDFPGFWRLLKIYCNKLYDKYHDTVDWIGRFRDGNDMYEWWLADMSIDKWLEER